MITILLIDKVILMFHDNVLASAIIDRIVHYSTIIVIKGPSYRGKNFKKGGGKKLVFQGI